jgi:hypothetical protein
LLFDAIIVSDCQALKIQFSRWFMKKSSVSIFLAITIFGMANVLPLSAQTIWIGNGGIPIQQALIQNLTGLYCSFVAYGKVVGELAPGETAYLGAGAKAGKKKGVLKKVVSFHGGGFGYYAGWDTIPAPIIGRCFSDAAHGQYLGEVDAIFNIPGAANSSTFTWIIQPGNIKCADESSCGSTLPRIGGRKAFALPLPSSWGGSLSAIQILNNSQLSFVIRTTIDAGGAQQLEPGEIHYVTIRGPRAVSVKIDAVDPATGTVVGAWSRDFYGQYNGYYGENIVLNRGSFH